MVNTNTIKCGNSNAVYNAAPVAKPEAVARRKRVAIHFAAAAPAPGGFRVVARLADGRDALLCTVDSFAEAVRAAWARTADVPANAVRIAVEKWEGTRAAGRWATVATAPGELPWIPPAVKARRRNRLGA